MPRVAYLFDHCLIERSMRMCCFSRPVESVTNTRIFARASKALRQFLVYQMVLKAAEDLAMILPLPVPKGTRESSVRFIDMKPYPTFFTAMDSGFPQPAPKTSGGGFGGGSASGEPKLNVIDVGSFEASFVPTMNDFSRLDERFRLPLETWEKLPKFKDYGFAVFKLKKNAVEVHPMAFEFPRADRNQLFFPTVHIHNGEVHETAEFNHVLYAQFGQGHRWNVNDWTESMQPAGLFLKIKWCAGMVDDLAHVYKRAINGKYANDDIIA